MKDGIHLDDISPVRLPAYKPGILDHDSLDDRREVYHLLSKLPPAARVAWLEWACKNATLGTSRIRPTVAAKTRQLAAQARWDTAADERLTLEIFFDLFQMSINFRVDFEALLKGLEAQVRRLGAV